MRFQDMGLHGATLSALEAMGFEEATPIQAETIPALLEGRDVIGQAQTGTGKTAAFGIPLVEMARSGRRGLVLTPTRELAQQVQREIQAIGKGSPIDVVCLIGGAHFGEQVKALDRHPNATLVATPGRILDHLERGTMNLDGISIFVLDEADEMMSMGFQDELDALVAQLPEERQTVLFTATLPPPIEKLAKKALHDPATVRVDAGPATNVRQCFIQLAGRDRPAAIRRILEAEAPRAALLFVKTRARVDDMVRALDGLKVEGIHGGMQQGMRDAVMGRFRQGRTQVLVATDVAARGLDVDEVDLVLHDDFANDADTYVHRMGRTGRAGRSGLSILFITPGKIKRLGMLRPVTGRLDTYDLPSDDAMAKLRTGRLVEEIAELGVLAAARDALNAATEAGLSAEDVALRMLSQRLVQPAEEEAVVDVGDSLAISLKVGKMDNVRPNAIVGVLCNAGGLRGEDIGRIDILDRMSVVEVPAAEADRVVAAMAKVRLSGRPVMPRIADDWRFKTPPRK